jgi:hypothetical protein
MSQMGFEPTILAFERAKTVHALDRAATVVGLKLYDKLKISRKYFDCSYDGFRVKQIIVIAT